MNKNLSVIGTVLGETNLNEFSFTLKSHKASKGDIICTQTKIPSSENENKVVYEPVKLNQEFRNFDFMSPWEGAEYILSKESKDDLESDQ